MAEALAAVGTIANIIQLVDAGLKVLHRLEEYQSQIQDLPEAFRHIKTELPALLDALQHTKTAIDTGSLPDESKRAVLPVVEGCATRIKLLDEILEKVVPASKDSWAARGKKAIQSIRYEGRMGNITTAIRGYIQTLTYHRVVTASFSRPSAGMNRVKTKFQTSFLTFSALRLWSCSVFYHPFPT